VSKKILFTGSSTGIGRFSTMKLLQEGHSVWGVSRSDQSSLSTEARSLPGKFFSSQCDVSSWEEVSQLAKEVEAQWGSLDGLICASGIQGSVGPAMTTNPLEWQNTVNANLNGTFFTLRSLYPLLMKTHQERGKVICFSGGGATSSRPNFSAYAVAKTGIVRLVEVLADEWKEQNIDINSIAPGAIHTRMTEEVIAMGPHVVGQKEYDSALKVKATGGGSLEKVYGLVRFLLSGESNCLSGRLISAQWDAWEQLGEKSRELSQSEVFTLRRVMPQNP
jgi:NAD(P)-dependent dehydrogenase (short-subunit alcohol dehydrogenase family)